MRPLRFFLSSAFLCAALHLPVQAQQLPAAITTDPAPDKAYPAAMETFQIPSLLQTGRNQLIFDPEQLRKYHATGKTQPVVETATVGA